MKRLLLALLVTSLACRETTAPIDAPTLVPGAWTASTSFYTQIRVRMTERADGQLFGNWAGDLAVCSTVCRDTGTVAVGERKGSAMTFLLSSANTQRSLNVAGTLAADSSIVGTAARFDNGVKFAPDAITLRRK